MPQIEYSKLNSTPVKKNVLKKRKHYIKHNAILKRHMLLAIKKKNLNFFCCNEPSSSSFLQVNLDNNISRRSSISCPENTDSKNKDITHLLK